MKSIGIKLADGSFYPILDEGSLETKDLEVTTVKDNQTKVQIDLYRSETNSMDDAEYVDSLEITHLRPHPNGEPSLSLQLNLDSNNKLHAQMKDPETGKSSETQIALVSRTIEERTKPANFALNDAEDDLTSGMDSENSIFGSPNDEAFSFDPISDIPDLEDDIDDTTIDLNSLDIDSIAEAQVSDDFMTDSQVIDDNMVSDKPLTDQDMLSPEDLFNDAPESTDEEIFIDKDGTGFSFVDDSAEETTSPTDTSEENYEVPSTLLDPSLFDETSGKAASEESQLENSEVDLDIAPPDFSDLELDDLELNSEAPIEDDANLDSSSADIAPEAQEEQIEETVAEGTEEKNPYDLPDFDDLTTEETKVDTNIEPAVEPEPPETDATAETDDFSFSLPDFDDLDTSSIEDSGSVELNLPDSGEEVVEEEKVDAPVEPDATDDFAPTEINAEPKPEETETNSSDLDLNSLDLPDFGDIDLNSTAEPEPEEKKEDDFSLDLPDFGEDGTADTDSLLPNMNINFESESTDTQKDTEKFDIDDMDLPDFDNLEAKEEASDSIPTDFPSFSDPFDSLSSPTANTDFDFPDFDDSPAKMELESERQESQTKDIFGDFDDTDAVFEGDTDGFVNPNGKKKSKKQKKVSRSYGSGSELSDDEEKSNRKPVIILLIALLACLAVILVLVLQSRTPKTVKKASQEIAKLQKTESTQVFENVDSEEKTKPSTQKEIVTSMGEPRNPAENDSKTLDTSSSESATTESKPVEPETKPVEVAAKSEDKKPAEADKETYQVKRPTVETAKRVEHGTPVIIPGKEDVIIVASNAETVVPLEKPKSNNSAADIKYTVVWGDTLWDISTAYYKTPYRYNRIAEYNGLTDANRIKTGQVLLIPAE